VTKSGPRSPHYDERLRRVRALLNEGKYDEAAAAAQAALDDYPQWVEAWILMGSARDALGSIDEAVFALSEAVRLARALLQRALTNYAYFTSVIGSFEEAEKAYKEALAFGGETAGLHYFLARTQSVLGKNDEALQHFRRAAELEPDYRESIREEFPDVARALNIPLSDPLTGDSAESPDEESMATDEEFLSEMEDEDQPLADLDENNNLSSEEEE
jgi:tetratricopeptide (TPR) repeat protein